MGGMKDIFISIQEDLIIEMFPEKGFGDLTDKEYNQLWEASLETYKDMMSAAYDTYKESLKMQGKWPPKKDKE